jgi:restriction system protein
MTQDKEHNYFLINIKVELLKYNYKLVVCLKTISVGVDEMAGIWLNQGILINELSEISGYKTGLCLTLKEMKAFIGTDEISKLFSDNLNSGIRIRPEEYEMLYFRIIRGSGHIPTNSIDPSPYIGISLFNKYKNDPQKLDVFTEVYSLFPAWIKRETERAIKCGKKSISPEWFINENSIKHGTLGLNMSLEIVNHLVNYEEISPWNSVRRVNWINTIDLKNLFYSESLDTFYGSFLDQRYIDYLSNHLDDIGNINWRKFEGLTCEYFQKQGYYVQIGSGRNDGGIDARIWKTDQDKENPPLIIVQCKRQKSKVEKVVVKALWADMHYEKAKSGLIVTSSEVSEGAKNDCSARGYNINFAERKTLDKWIEELRTPYTGIIL